MVQIIWSEKSKNDLKQIYEYIAKNSPFYAKRTIDKLRLRTKILRNNIRSGKIVPEFNIEILRELIEGNFRIIYQIANETMVEIVTIFHASRDLSKLKFEND